MNKVHAAIRFILFWGVLAACTPAQAQCLSEIPGSYGVRFCVEADTAQWPSYLSTIALHNDSQLVFRNFHNIPAGLISCEDTIIANYRCSDDSLFFQMVHYASPNLQYIGKGHRQADTIEVRYIQLNPSGSQNICLHYVKGWLLPTSNPGSMSWQLYPNPVASGFPLRGWPEHTAKVSVLDMQGRLVWEWNTPSSSEFWPAQLEAGMYLIQVALPSGNAVKTFRITAL